MWYHMSLREDLIVIQADLDRLRDRVDRALKELVTFETAASLKADEPIENLKLSRRALTCLQKAGIKTISQLASKAYRDLWQLNNCGQYTVRNIDRALNARGLTLKGEYFDMGEWRPKRAPRRKPEAQGTQE